jgi:MFS family permease
VDGGDLVVLAQHHGAALNAIQSEEFPKAAAVSRYPWILLALLWSVAFLNSADRTILIAVMPQIRAQFGLSPTQLALISSSFFWIYAIAAFFSGRMGDRASRSKVILYGLVFWSVATGVASLATGVGMLIALRGLVALGESTYFPTATALISDWHEPQMRSRALSVHQTAVFAGAGVGALTAGVMADRFGWRMPYVVFGIAGLALCFVLRKWLRDAPPRSTTTRAHRQPRHSENRPGPDPVTLVLRNPSALFLCIVFLLATGASNAVSIWSPTFLHDTLGLDLGESAFYGSTTINVAGFLAVPLGGLLADSLTARTSIGRFYALTIGLSAAAVCLAPLTLAHSALAVGLVLLASGIGKGLFDGCIYAAMHDVVPPEARATAVGLMTMMGFFGAGATPILVAQAGDHYGMGVGITLLAILYLVAVALLLATRGITRQAVARTRALEATH